MKINIKGSTVEKASSCYVGDAAASRREKDWNDSKWMVRRRGWRALWICLLKISYHTFPKAEKDMGRACVILDASR